MVTTHRIVAVVPAGGVGKRMGAGSPKQFLLLGGVPLMLHALRVLDRTPGVTDVVLVVPKEEQARTLTDVVERYGITKVLKVVPGGATRQESVSHGLNEVGEGVEIVVVHDAVRPFVTEGLIERSITAARAHGGAIIAVPMKETPKQAGGDGLIQRTLDRADLWLAQTPQTFRRAVIVEAYRKAALARVHATDDAALAERLGHPVAIVAGSWENIKITTPDDMVLAEAILAARKGRA